MVLTVSSVNFSIVPSAPVTARAPLITMPLKRLETESLVVHEARIAAVRNLGRNWVNHPAYDFNPRHSNNPDLSNAARAPYLAGVAARAAADRGRNPMFHSAEAMRAAVAGYAL